MAGFCNALVHCHSSSVACATRGAGRCRDLRRSRATAQREQVPSVLIAQLRSHSERFDDVIEINERHHAVYIESDNIRFAMHKKRHGLKIPVLRTGRRGIAAALMPGTQAKKKCRQHHEGRSHIRVEQVQKSLNRCDGPRPPRQKPAFSLPSNSILA